MSDLTLVDVIGSKKPGFNADVHPEILMRMIMLGYEQRHIAEVMGIDVPMLERWISRFPELRVAERRAAAADSEVALSVFYMAVGYDPVSGETTAPDLKAAMFWMKCHAGWTEATAPTLSATARRNRDDTDLSASELQSTATALVRKMQDQLDAPPPAPAAPPDADF